MRSPDRVILAPVFLLVAGLACGPPKAAVSPPPAEQRLDRLEAEVGALRAELQARAPFAGLPKRNADGKPQRVDPRAIAEDGALTREPNCPEKIDVRVRAQQGSSCADYQAELSPWLERCVPACDAGDAANRATRAGMSACSAWCTERHCGTASFIPPAMGCIDGQCYNGSKECPNKECPWREYCSLIGGTRAWNCFCRDMIIL